jgi:hypothetical protein
VEFTGVTGDFDATNPADLTSTLYIDNIRPGDEGVLVYINADLTNNGFSFHDVHFDFTLGAQGSNYNVGSEGVFLQVVGFNEVPEPATFALFCIGLAGLGWSRRKRA